MYRVYYQLPMHYTKKRPVKSLVYSGGAQYLGLYMAIYEDCINRNGNVSREWLIIKALELGVSKKSFFRFLDVAMRERLIVPCTSNLNGMFYLPDVKAIEKRRQIVKERFNQFFQVMEEHNAI